MDKIFNKPFAVNGARVAIPENGTENERVSFDKGFTQPYEVEAPSVDNPGGQGFNILRPEMNEALYQLSSACNVLAENIDKWTALTTENLNNITQKGRYFQATQSQATSVNNYPTNETGYLIVFDSVNGNVSQFYKVANKNTIFSRVKNGNEWSGWEIITSDYSIGNKQSYYNVLNERERNVEYQNSTGRPILVIITLGTKIGATINTTISLKVREVEIVFARYGGSVGFSRPCFISAIVPPNETYMLSINPNSQDVIIQSWAELR